MTVKLIWATTDADQMVAYIARVSSPATQDKPETAAKLIGYLIKNKHWSPFEMANLCVEIEAPRDVTRQIIRHRSFSFSEFSYRYASVDALPETPLRDARMQHPTNRQASVACADALVAEEWLALQDDMLRETRIAYEWALSHGIAKEVARAVLPEGLTMSRLYMNGSLRSWLHFCDLRRGNGTQPETQAVAEACWSVLRETCPVIVEAWESVQ